MDNAWCEGSKMKECEFCNAIKNNDSSKSDLLAGELIKLRYSTVAFYKNQVFKGKFLVIFNRHVEDLTELDQKESDEFYQEMLTVAKALKKIFKPDKMNYALLGNTIFHIHWHVIPRYKNDPNWGNPPWPHGEVYLPDEEVKQIIKKVKRELK